MSIQGRRSLVLALTLASMGIVTFWATSSLAAKPERAMLPSVEGRTEFCPDDGLPHEWHQVSISAIGTFQETPVGKPSPLVVRIGQQYVSKSGLKTVPLQILSISGNGSAEGIGETRFWLDPTRPMTSGIWEKRAGTEFPAVQEMRFHFFYTLEAMPGRIFRSVNPAIMRSENVTAFPPTPGTSYRLVKAVELEDVAEPGIVVGRILANHVVVPKPGAGIERPAL